MLFFKYLPGGIPVNKVTVILSFFLLVLLAVGGAVIFRKNIPFRFFTTTPSCAG